MDRERMVRESERAAVERWFPESPLGQLFDPGDGNLLPMPSDAVAGWRDAAFARIDRFVAESQTGPWLHALAILLFAAAVAGFGQLFGVPTGIALGAGVAVGTVLLHGWGIWQLWRFRRDLAALRGRIRAELAGRSPLPRELADRFRRRNVWRTALHVWVGSLAALALLGQHFLPPERVPPALVLAGLVAIGIGWILFFLSRRVDLGYRR